MSRGKKQGQMHTIRKRKQPSTRIGEAGLGFLLLATAWLLL